MANKSIGKLTKKIDKQEYDVEWKNDRILYIPVNKKDKAYNFNAALLAHR